MEVLNIANTSKRSKRLFNRYNYTNQFVNYNSFTRNSVVTHDYNNNNNSKNSNSNNNTNNNSDRERHIGNVETFECIKRRQ